MKKLMRKDLTGKRFGKLLAINVDESRSNNGNVFWKCNCDCGNTVSIRSTSLTRKKNGTKSCGCARNSESAKLKAKETRQKYLPDITGLKFGRLTVIRKTDLVSTRACDNGSYLWECLCECGNLCYHSRYSLITSRGVRSCGCLYNDSRYFTGKKYCEYDIDTYDFGIGYCENGTYFFFDKEDYDKIKEYSWWYDGRYVCAHTLKFDSYTTGIIRLHRHVLNINDREDINVDHKNLIRYDCRKINLRRASDSQNAMNKDYSYMSSTGIVGVRKDGLKWVVSIKVNSTTINLGRYTDFEGARKARIDAEIKYFGEFRYDLDNKDIIDESNLEKYKSFKRCV